ncbi:hypothetical protein [Streptomyces sp. b62]|uniref:hypothetical protein n=1 Tax=Streptomyces sp. b62 TaxID=1827627 RepID=UPI000BF1EF8A|nr:hypothetical protein [Streptomyces sp. b62]
MKLHLINDVPDGLTRRARTFVGTHGVKVDVRPVEGHREWWLERDVPPAVIDRMAAYQDRWGGLLLPPAPQYDGGPKYLDPDSPEEDSAGWWFEAGMQRTAVPYSFMISPSGEFGMQAEEWAPLHATIEGWVESVALAHHASGWAKQVAKLVGEDVASIDLTGYEQVREVMGLTDTWWRGQDALIALYSGEAAALNLPRGRTAVIYSGLDERGLRGGADDDG